MRKKSYFFFNMEKTFLSRGINISGVDEVSGY